ncbi:MAG: hypothetical protein AABW73_04530 [Nanoarchaeota archaeon]
MDMRYIALSIQRRRPAAEGTRRGIGEPIKYGFILSYDAMDTQDTKETSEVRRAFEEKDGRVLYEGPDRTEAKRLVTGQRKYSEFLADNLI